jgi:serine/threonine protein kinase
MPAVGAGGYCPACGSTHDRDQRFCHTCGEPLTGTSAIDPWIGVTLGRYEIQRVVASGGMGVVYAARDPQLGRTVALKLLRDDLAADADFRRRFVRESRSAASLDHPNILPVFDAGEVDGVLYIATRLVDARDLRHLLAEEGELSVPRALAICAQVASALDFAHERAMVHRDVKPANILVDPGHDRDDDHAYLIDFGITKQSAADHTLTQSGMFVGTPEFVAPEQASGSHVDGRADQYALACVLYSCLAGSPPFSASNAIDVLHAHLYTPPPRIGDDRRGLPASVETALLRAMSKDREDRYATCRAFVAAARAGTGLPTPATPRPQLTVAQAPHTARRREVAAAAPPAPAARRGSTLAIAAVAVIALIAAGVGVAALLASKDSRTADDNTTALRPARGTNSATAPAPAPPPAVRTAPLSLVPVTDSDRDTKTYDQIGYSIRLPAHWKLIRNDRPQVTSATSRLRTEVAKPGRTLSIVVDHLRGFDQSPQDNRALLIKNTAKNRTGYITIGTREYPLENGVTGYELRYRYDSESGDDVRRVDVLLSIGDDHDFGVLAGGNARYDDLADLAKAAAGSIALTEDPDTSGGTGTATRTATTPASVPDDGTYSGTAHEDGSSTDSYPITMHLDGDDGTIDYGDGDCTGSLSFDGIDDQAVNYSETITDGSCPSGGTWRITAESDTKIRATWSAPGEDRTISAELDTGE